MKKKFIIYEKQGKILKAVLDEGLYEKYRSDASISNIQEFSNEILLEQNYASMVGKPQQNKKFLYG